MDRTGVELVGDENGDATALVCDSVLDALLNAPALLGVFAAEVFALHAEHTRRLLAERDERLQLLRMTVAMPRQYRLADHARIMALHDAAALMAAGFPEVVDDECAGPPPPTESDLAEVGICPGCRFPVHPRDTECGWHEGTEG